MRLKTAGLAAAAGLGVAGAATTVGAVILARALAKRMRAQPSFAGQVVVITGGSRGLGFALAEEFAGRGAHIVICARDQSILHEAALIPDRVWTLRRARVESTSRPRTGGRRCRCKHAPTSSPCGRQESQAAAGRLASGRRHQHDPQTSRVYCVIVLTASPTLKSEPDTGVPTAEMSSTSVRRITPTSVVILRMTAPVEGSLISLVTRLTVS